MEKKYDQQEKDFFAHPDLEVIYQLLKLKNLFRQGWLKRDIPKSHGESVADHIFGTAITAWILSKHLDLKLDESKLLKMALIHEAGEIYAGDITPVDGITTAEKYELELQSISDVFSSYPGGDEFISLWKEFEAEKSPESIFLKQIDKFEMGIQASIYQGHGFDQMQEFITSANYKLTDEKLIELFNQIIIRKETL